MNAITPTVPAAINPATAICAADSLRDIVKVAINDQGVDVAKLEVLLRMWRDIAADDAKLQFNRAMSAVQAEMLPVLRDAINEQTRSKYARLETIDGQMRPIYTRHGFALSFDSEPIDGANIRIACEVTHTAGHSKTFHLEAALDLNGPQGRPNKTPLHGLGSSVSHLRRYLTCMIFHVVMMNEDNDGNRTRDGELAGRTQADELYRLLAECSADPKAVEMNERAFLTKMGMADLRTIKDLPVGHFGRCRNALLTKKSIMQQRATITQTGEAA